MIGNEKGFYHPSMGYWQTLVPPTKEELATYPAGTIEVPLKPDSDFEWVDHEWLHIPPPALTPEELRAQMPNLSAVEFREALRNVVLPDYPDGISKAQIQAAIDRIPTEKDRDRAQDYWDRATFYSRANPIVDQLAGLLVPPVTPEQIDQLWPKLTP